MSKQYYLFCEAYKDEEKSTIVKHTLDQPLSKKGISQASYLMACHFPPNRDSDYEKTYVIAVFGGVDYIDVIKHLEYTNSRRSDHVYKIDNENYLKVADKVTRWRRDRKPTRFKDGSITGKKRRTK